jgi:hypothetical protein
MGRVIDKKKYLDFDGLKKYDELIKKYMTYVHDDIDKSIKGYVDDKVNEIREKISDIDTIRSNAKKGASAIQEEDLGFVTDADIDNIFK